jgi:hypothetical protein
LFLFCFFVFSRAKRKISERKKKRERKTKSRKIESIKRNGVWHILSLSPVDVRIFFPFNQ